MRYRNWIGLVGITWLQVASLAAGENQIIPLHPEKLLEVLPAKIKDWELTKSTGWMGEGAGIESRAVREFTREAEGQSAGDEAKALVTRISLLDTAECPGSDIDLFKNFKPVSSDRYEKKRINGHKSIVLHSRRGNTTARILVRDRWVLSITLGEEESDKLVKWIRSVNLSKLAAVETQKGPVPEELLSVTIDELDSSNNSTYRSEKSVDEIPEVIENSE